MYVHASLQDRYVCMYVHASLQDRYVCMYVRARACVCDLRMGPTIDLAAYLFF